MLIEVLKGSISTILSAHGPPTMTAMAMAASTPYLKFFNTASTLRCSCLGFNPTDFAAKLSNS